MTGKCFSVSKKVSAADPQKNAAAVVYVFIIAFALIFVSGVFFDLAVTQAAADSAGSKSAAVKEPLQSESKAEASKFAVPRNDINGLKNFARVSDILYRGEQPNAEGFRELKKMGIKTILSLRAFHSDRSMLKGLGMYYKRMGIYTWDFKDDYVVNFLKLVTNPKYQPVFIHCQHGADRTGTLCAIYRCAVEGWKMEDAIKEMQNFGFHKIWSNLKKYLNSIEPSKIMTEVQKAATVEAELVK